MGCSTKSLSSNSHHQKRIFSYESNKSLKTSKAASDTFDQVISADVVCWVGIKGLVFGEVADHLEDYL